MKNLGIWSHPRHASCRDDYSGELQCVSFSIKHDGFNFSTACTCMWPFETQKSSVMLVDIDSMRHSPLLVFIWTDCKPDNQLCVIIYREISRGEEMQA